MWISRGRWSALSGSVLLGAVLLVFAAGCSSVNAPRSSVPPVAHGTFSLGGPSAPSPSPSPSLSREDEVVGVVRQFFKALDKAAQTGDTSDLVAVTYERCPCRALGGFIQREFSEGRRDDGARWSLTRSEFLAFDRGTALVRVNYGVSAYRNLARDGTVRVSYSARSADGLVRLGRHGNRWLVTDLYRGHTR